MSSDQEIRARRNLAAAAVALVLIVILGVAFKFLIYPKIQEGLVAQTSTGTAYTSTFTVCGDSFAGYAVVRSPEMKRELGSRGIRLNWVDDAADYTARTKALRDGSCDAAVHTVDADLVTGVELGEFPASMIFVIDESRGADGVVAYQAAVANVQALNQSGTKIVVTPNSPSETLARQMISGMLPVLTAEPWLEQAEGAEAVYKALARSNPSDRKAYVLWEPWLSKALAIDGVARLYDSSATLGAIVDVLVVNRAYLSAHVDDMVFFTAAYFRSLWHYTSQADGMVGLVMQDAKEMGSELTREQADVTVAGIQWKTTLENYAHMGITPRFEAKGIQSMEEMISGISRFLVRTGKLRENPVEEREHELYYDAVLRELKAQAFHPGGQEQMRGHDELPALDAVQWKALTVVGNLDAKVVVFKRNASELSPEGRRDVSEIARQLKGWPAYYITVEGHARADAADQAAAGELALSRAQSVSEALASAGISKNRVRTVATPSTQHNGEGQSVTFVLAQKPF